MENFKTTTSDTNNNFDAEVKLDSEINLGQ